MKPRWLSIALVIWLAAVVAGHAALWRVAHQAGTAAEPPRSWPEITRLPRDPARATLVAFLQPSTECSRATLAEVSDVVASAGARLRTIVVLSRPAGTSPAWEVAALAAVMRAVPGAVVLVDAGGYEAALFGAAASGQLVLYSASGSLAYAGGITMASGAWDDHGRAAVLATLGINPAVASAPRLDCLQVNCRRPER